MKTLRTLSVLILLLVVTGHVVAQGTRVDAGSVRGRVFNAVTQEPVIRATVQIEGTRLGAFTNAEGRFTINNVPTGTYRVRATSIGYETRIETDVVVTSSRPATLEIAMLEQAVSADEVVVRPEYFDERLATGTSTRALDNEEIRRLPGGFEDVARAVSSLPGVAQVSNGRNDLLVRGGGPSENLFLIDGIEVPNINHFGTQGSGGGPLSFVNLDYVSDVRFSTGGFAAEYGDRLSSVLEIDLRNGRDDRAGGKATISATQFGLNLEGPLSEDAELVLSARRSYLDLIFRAAGFSFVPEYWDFLARASYRPSQTDRVSVLAIGAIDRVVQFNDDEEDRFKNSRILDNSQDQLVGGVSWRHLFEDGFVTTTLGGVSVDYRFRQTDSLLKPVFVNTSAERELNARVDALLDLNGTTRVRFGGQARLVDFGADIALEQPGFSLAIAPSDVFTKAALFLTISQRVGDGVDLSIGARGDYFSGIEEKIVPSFRASLAASLDPLSRLTLSGGRYYQAPSYIWLVANEDNRSLEQIRSDVAVLGIDRLLDDDLRVSVEGYYKNYGSYPASISRPFLVLANVGADFGGAEEGFASFGLEPLSSEGSGRAYGAELLVQKKLSESPWYGVASLAWGRSLFTGGDGIERPGSFDQQIIANLSGGLRLGEYWEIATRFRFASGRPYTPVDSTGDPTFGYRVTSQYHAERLAPSHALDLRVDRRWPLGNWTLITYIDVQNVYDRRNEAPPRWNSRTRTAEANGGQIGLLPSIGVSAEF